MFGTRLIRSRGLKNSTETLVRGFANGNARKPPPPPPPPKRGTTSRSSARPGVKNSGSSSSFLTLLVVGAGSAGIYQYWKQGKSEEDDFEKRYGADVAPIDEQKPESSVLQKLNPFANKKEEENANVARAVLQELAESGDVSASRALIATDTVETEEEEEDQDKAPEVFRLDVSVDGMVKMLRMMLEAKRQQERLEIARIRKIPVYQRQDWHEEELRRFRQEKREIKDKLKSLQKRGTR